MGPLIYLFTLVKLALVESTCDIQTDLTSITVFSPTTLTLATDSADNLDATITLSSLDYYSGSALTQTISSTSSGTFEFFAMETGTLVISLNCGSSGTDELSLTVAELSLSGLGPTVIHI